MCAQSGATLRSQIWISGEALRILHSSSTSTPRAGSIMRFAFAAWYR